MCFSFSILHPLHLLLPLSSSIVPAHHVLASFMKSAVCCHAAARVTLKMQAHFRQNLDKFKHFLYTHRYMFLS